MDTALVTGADRGIGLQIARQLVELGYRVYGLANSFAACNWQHHDFLQISCDLSRLDHLQLAWEHIAKHDPQVNVVVHAAANPAFAKDFESAAAQDIAHSVQSGLLAPLLLTRWALPNLIRFRGYVINIGWSGQGACPQGAIVAAIEGGLSLWTQSLFEELRDTGVKVCTIYPQRNSGETDPKARLKLEPQSEVDAGFVAKAVAQILQFKENNLVTQLVVRPQGTREEPRIAPNTEPLLGGPKDIVLPDPDKRPPPFKPIPTPEPQRPDDAWEFDDEGDDEWEEDDELDALLESSRRLLREQNETARRQLQRTREKTQHTKDRSARTKDRDAGKQQRSERSTDKAQRTERKTDSQQRSERRANDSQHTEGGTDKAQRSERGTDDTQRGNRDTAAVQSARADDAPARQASHTSERTPSDAETPDNGEEGKRRRRRRRGGRGRNRRSEDAHQTPLKEASAAEPSQTAADRQPPAAKQQQLTAKEQQAAEKQPAAAGLPLTADKKATSSASKPSAVTATAGNDAATAATTAAAAAKAPATTSPVAKPSAAKTPAAKAAEKRSSAAKPAPAPNAPDSPTATGSPSALGSAPSVTKQQATTKAAVKKTAAKKTATKKAVAKKVAVKKTPVKKIATKTAAKKVVKKAATKKTVATTVATKTQD